MAHPRRDRADITTPIERQVEKLEQQADKAELSADQIREYLEEETQPRQQPAAR